MSEKTFSNNEPFSSSETDKFESDELCERAERFVGEQHSCSSRAAPGDLQAMMHDLEVHQVELRMQNEDLCKSQMELELSRDRYSDLYDFAPTGYVTLSEKGTIVEANMRAAEFFGIERGRLVGKFFNVFVAPDGKKDFLHFLDHCRESQKEMPVETEIELLPGQHHFEPRGSRHGLALWIELESYFSRCFASSRPLHGRFRLSFR